MPNTPRNQIPYPGGLDLASGPAHLGALALSVDDHAKDLEGTYAARPAASYAGRFYYATDKGIVYRDTGSSWQALHAVPFLTSWSPPAALTEDGMVIDYSPVAGSIWRVRYRAASASVYKWEVISAPAITSEINTDQTTTSTTFVDLDTNGPDVTTLREGDYYIEVGCNAYHEVAAQVSGFVYMSYSIGGVAAIITDGVRSRGRSQDTDFSHSSQMRCQRKNAIPASTLIRAKYKGPGTAVAHFRWRTLRVRPIRII